VLDIGFSRRLAKINFEDRATIRHDRVVYRLADGSGHVTLDLYEWRTMLAEFDAECAKVLRIAKRVLVGLLPAILLYTVTLGWVIPGGKWVTIAAFYFGAPGIYLWQSSRIERIARELDGRLAQRPKVAAPLPQPWRVPRWLEILSALLVGPHLLLEVYGSIDPDAYIATPLMGTSLDWTSLISFSVIAVLVYFRWRASRRPACRRHRIQPAQLAQRASAARKPPDGPSARTFGRRVDQVAGARDTDT
jgi:hypothetical protein